MEDFMNIWLPLSERFYRVAWYLLESEQDAEDAVQELYLKLWKLRGSLKDLHNPAAYGISLLKNICIDRVRRREVRRIRYPDDRGCSEISPPDRQIAAKDILKKVMQEIDKLPEKQAEVMRLMILEDADYRNISERTGLSQVHVRVLVSTARKTLKQKLRL